MSQPSPQGPFNDLFTALRDGSISRRQFIERSTALGMATGVAMFCANSVGVMAQGASPAATPTASEGVAASVNTESQQRGAGGELRILQWQAPSHLSGQQATGDKDGLGASFISEPLMYRGADGLLIPNLIKEVPTVENGLLAGDFTSVTFNVKEGVLWSDGQPFTAADIVFTVNWVLDDANGGVYQETYRSVSTIEAVDELTVKIAYSQPNPTWSDGYTGSGGSVMYPKHVLEAGGTAANDAFRLNPIGTGPYKVESFAPNDQLTLVVNDNYREPNKPFFAKVIMKGGGDAASAGRAVIQTGEYDFGWNIAVEPEIAKSFESEGSPGVFVVTPSLSIERININFSDPATEVTTDIPAETTADGTPVPAQTVTQRSEMNTPHPLFSDIAVRQAMNLAIDRETIANSLFFGGTEEPAVVNILSGIPSMESPNTSVVYDKEAAKKVLDDAGWAQDGDVRKKDGKELRIDYMTTVSQIRQKIQAIVKQDLEEVGFKVEIKQIDGAIFFDSAAGNDQSNTHFYNDLNMFQSAIGAPPPVAYMIRWYAGPDGGNIAQASNQWSGRNFQRYNNPEYDKVYEASTVESDPEKQAALFIQMNDMLFNDAAVLPLVRVGSKSAVSRTLNMDNIAFSPYEFSYWNIANWNRNV